VYRQRPRHQRRVLGQRTDGPVFDLSSLKETTMVEWTSRVALARQWMRKLTFPDSWIAVTRFADVIFTTEDVAERKGQALHCDRVITEGRERERVRGRGP